MNNIREIRRTVHQETGD